MLFIIILFTLLYVCSSIISNMNSNNNNNNDKSGSIEVDQNNTTPTSDRSLDRSLDRTFSSTSSELFYDTTYNESSIVINKEDIIAGNQSFGVVDEPRIDTRYSHEDALSLFNKGKVIRLNMYRHNLYSIFQ